MLHSLLYSQDLRSQSGLVYDFMKMTWFLKGSKAFAFRFLHRVTSSSHTTSLWPIYQPRHLTLIFPVAFVPENSWEMPNGGGIKWRAKTKTCLSIIWNDWRRGMLFTRHLVRAGCDFIKHEGERKAEILKLKFHAHCLFSVTRTAITTWFCHLRVI